MSRSLDDIMASLPEERRQCIEARATKLLEQEQLRQLRKALGLSQKDLAELMNISQPAVSRQEHRAGMQVRTLAGIVEAMGGTLEVTAKFPDREPVRLV